MKKGMTERIFTVPHWLKGKGVFEKKTEELSFILSFLSFLFTLILSVSHSIQTQTLRLSDSFQSLSTQTRNSPSLLVSFIRILLLPPSLIVIVVVIIRNTCTSFLLLNIVVIFLSSSLFLWNFELFSFSSSFLLVVIPPGEESVFQSHQDQHQHLFYSLHHRHPPSFLLCLCVFAWLLPLVSSSAGSLILRALSLSIRHYRQLAKSFRDCSRLFEAFSKQHQWEKEFLLYHPLPTLQSYFRRDHSSCFTSVSLVYYTPFLMWENTRFRQFLQQSPTSSVFPLSTSSDKDRRMLHSSVFVRNIKSVDVFIYSCTFLLV